MARLQFVILNYRLRCFSWFPLWPVVLRVVWKTNSKIMDGFTLNLSICFHHLSCTGGCRCLGVHPHCVKLKVGQLHLGLFTTSSLRRETNKHPHWQSQDCGRKVGEPCGKPATQTRGENMQTPRGRSWAHQTHHPRIANYCTTEAPSF